MILPRTACALMHQCFCFCITSSCRVYRATLLLQITLTGFLFQVSGTSCLQSAMACLVQGTVSWITQLVVHSEYRQRGVAKKLCRMAWAVDHYYAAGLVTSHPYAVRAMERATERSCCRDTIMHAAHEILAHCAIPYVQGKTLCFENGRCAHQQWVNSNNGSSCAMVALSTLHVQEVCSLRVESFSQRAQRCSCILAALPLLCFWMSCVPMLHLCSKMCSRAPLSLDASVRQQRTLRARNVERDTTAVYIEH
jgi:hypothetical protein